MPLSEGEAVTKVSDPQHSQKLLRVLRTFWQEQSFHDALLVVGEEELPVQKNILAAASPYIRSVQRLIQLTGDSTNPTIATTGHFCLSHQDQVKL